jgi:type I restriction enzyme S subunit
MSELKPYFRGVLIMNNEKDFKDLPEGWKWVRLGEVCKNLKAGGTPARDKLDYWGGNIPFALVEDLTKNKYLTSTSETITEKGLKNSSAWIVPKNSILMSIYASLGEVAINKIDTSANQAILGIILKENYDLKFIYHLLKFNKNNFEKFTTQTTQKNLNKKIVSELKFALPTSLPEQQKIVEILETIDNAIEKTDKIIEKYKRIKQGLMQDLLTKGIDENGNIRDEKTHKFKDSPLGRIPEEWEVVRLGEVLEYEQPQKYIVSTENHEDKSGTPVLTAGKTFILGYTSENFGIYNALPVILFDDFTTDAKFVNFPFKVKSSATKLLKAKDKNINLFYVFNTMQMIRVKPGSEHKRFWISEYSKLYIPLPPLPEQQRIAEILSQIDQTIEKEQQYKEKLQKIKQGLMQDLLTGKVRVNKLLEVENNELRKT